jgi:hypothetical protein
MGGNSIMENKASNRRNGPDPLVRLIGSITSLSWVLLFFITVFSWILISSIFIVSRVTKAPLEGFAEKQHQFNLSESWRVLLVNYSFYLLLFMFVLCTGGLILNSFRHNRKGDTYSKPLIIFIILSLIGILVHIIFL